MTTSNDTKLAAPGAGLPLPELLVARTLFATKRLTGCRRSFTAGFLRERVAIRRLVGACDESSLAKRILIRRPPGLEDSSRDWSVLMTLDHLRIVHHEFVLVIDALARETVPGGKASTAAVKPDPAVTEAVMPLYEASCDALLECVEAVPNLRTRTKYPHPWFGPMDASAWHALAGGHMTIHRVQIERILKGLAA